MLKHQAYLHLMTEAACTFFLLAIVVSLVGRKFRGWISDRFAAHPNYFWLVPASLILFNHFYLVMTGRGQQSNFWQLLTYFAVPSVVLFFRIGRGRDLKPELTDCGLAIWLWLPVVTGLVANNAIFALSVMVYVLLLFGNLRLNLNLSWEVPKSAWLHIASLIALWIALVSGLWVGGLIPLVPTHMFYRHQWALPVVLLLGFLGQSLFLEFLCRGVIQNWLRKYLPVAAAISAAAVFSGASFLAIPEWAFPNWTGASIALVIGGLCGYLYHRTESIMASAILNAVLNFSWWMFFKGGR